MFTKWISEAAQEAMKGDQRIGSFMRDGNKIAAINMYGHIFSVSVHKSINKAKNWSRLKGRGLLRNKPFKVPAHITPAQV